MIKNNHYKLGCHVSLSKINPISNKKYLVGSLYEALMYDADSFMIYTGAPQTTFRVNVDDYNITDFKKELKNNNFSIKNIIIHAPYIINISNPIDEKRDFAINFMKKEIIRAQKIGIEIIVLHPGNFLNSNLSKGLQNCADSLNKILLNNNKKIKIALETMAGKGTEICYKFEHFLEIFSYLDDRIKDSVGICIDTCHIFDAGYDIKNNQQEVLSMIKKLIPNEKIFCLHVNDSKFGLNSHKDRHDNINNGEIKIDGIVRFIFNNLFVNKIKILETPWINGKPPYKKEIFEIINYYKDNIE